MPQVTIGATHGHIETATAPAARRRRRTEPPADELPVVHVDPGREPVPQLAVHSVDKDVEICAIARGGSGPADDLSREVIPLHIRRRRADPFPEGAVGAYHERIRLASAHADRSGRS